ncbi:MAG: hypothetical protein ABI867_42610 [Kofleriaceae bacterium]
MKRALLVVLALAACDTPDLKIEFLIANGSFSQSCGTDSCADLQMQCASVLHLRVLSPSDPTVPHITVCEDVDPNADKDLCAISKIDLPVTTLPRETLEVQVTVWPRALVQDPTNPEKLDCARIPVDFDAVQGFPTSVPGPAYGGRAYYHPGDTTTIVTLGCTDVQSLITDCGEEAVQASATVSEFENLPFSVSAAVGEKLFVFIGEPTQSESEHVLLPDNTKQLSLVRPTPSTPSWSGMRELPLLQFGCIVVFENGTSAIHCRPKAATDGNTFNFEGIRLGKTTVDDVLEALALPEFPENGLTIGIVIDEAGNPLSNLVVGSTAGLVEYPNATFTGTNPTTSATGIFVSRDAHFGTQFTAALPGKSATGFGGRVQGNVTVVTLQPMAVVGGN